MTAQIRVVLAVVLTAHALAHVPGFLAAWQIRQFMSLPYGTTILGGAVDVGGVGTRILGVLWLATAVAMAVTGVAVVMRVGWAVPLLLAALGTSTALCVLGWPAARLGLLANFIVAALLLAAVLTNALAPALSD
jgi:hypothetical protein